MEMQMHHFDRGSALFEAVILWLVYFDKNRVKSIMIQKLGYLHRNAISIASLHTNTG